MKSIIQFILIICTAIPTLSFAQELSPINTYAPNAYNAGRQNWSITQADDKNIYFANNMGLLEFNGARWELYKSPNESIMRSVKASGNRIYSGCYMEFGFWAKDSFGQLNYTSLSNQLKVSLKEDEEFWNIIEFENSILFQSLDRIYIYDTTNKSFKILDSSSRITKIFQVDDAVYFQRINDGIYKIENGKDVLLTNNLAIANKIVINIFPQNDGLLIQTQNDGIYLFSDNQISEWSVSIKNNLSDLSVYSSRRLENNDFVFGTISKGVVYLSKDEISFQINQKNGLLNNTVLSVFEDADKNIWLGLDNGINSLNINSPFKVFHDDEGLLGSVYTSALHKGILYLGTNQGLFHKKLSNNNSFQFINGTKGQVWSLKAIDKMLFCGHNSGTFHIDGESATKISDVQGIWDLKQIPHLPSLILQGGYDGLSILEKKNGNWIFRNKIDGFEISSRFFEIYNENKVFVSHEYKGVFQLKISNDYKTITEVKKEDISKGLGSSLQKFENNIYYAYNDGVFKYDFSAKKFIRDEDFSKIYDSVNYISGKLMADKNSNSLFGLSKTDISFITPGKLSSKPNISKIYLPANIRDNITSYESVLNLGDEKYLLGTSRGYLIIDLSKRQINNDYQVKLDLIENSKSKAKNSLTVIDKSKKGIFENPQHNFKFSFSMPEFSKFSIKEYQYKLEGIYNSWSNWSTNSTEFFENLPYGNYTFKVRGKIGNDVTTNEASYAFKIKRPLLISNLAITIYSLAFLALIILTHYMYKSYYKKQRERLLQKTQKELALKELENKQQLMNYKNERLEQDINSKNRELAISTMSLIKKNEFLNNIKNELKNSKDGNLSYVVKLIDKNLNNTDDWKLFEEAFNNADKDFLKKMKDVHPKLTPNDLRLCAYLRLNLASKEIAPLLNISPKSVEVKRYRLRKKMGLAHESSLTNYILEM